MAVLYRIQKLVEKDSKDISILWKALTIIICITAAGVAMMSYIAQGRIYEGFEGVCILDSHIEFEEVSNNVHTTKMYTKFYAFLESEENTTVVNSNDTNKHYQINIGESQWGPISLCQFCQYTPVISVVIGSFWATMFSVCPRGGRNRHGLSEPWRIVPASFIFFVVIGSISAVASHRLNKYIAAFCLEFYPITNSTSCTEAVDLYTLHTHEDKIAHPVFKWLDVAIISLWLSTLCWISGALIMLVRFCFGVDFQISTTTVSDNRQGTSEVIEPSSNENLLRRSLKRNPQGGDMEISV